MTVSRRISLGFALRERVLTPSGELARVIGERTDGRLELEYVQALNPANAQVVLHPKLVRKLERGDVPLPAPVRIGSQESIYTPAALARRKG